MTTSNTIQTISDAILHCCNKVAKDIDDNAEKNSALPFDAKLGAGKGDKATAEFLKAVNKLLESNNFKNSKKPIVLAEEPIYEGSNSRFDFYIPGEQTVVEVALSLRNPTTEFEKDILKVLIFNNKTPIEAHIKKLVFIGKAGSKAKCEEPYRRAAIEWAKKAHDLSIFVHDIDHKLCPSS